MSEKSYNHTCNNTLARKRNVIDNVCVDNAFSTNAHFEDDKARFNSQMINRILHSRSFHMKVMKLAEGSFHKGGVSIWLIS